MSFYGFEIAQVRKFENNVFNDDGMGFFENIGNSIQRHLKDYEKITSHKNRYFIFEKIRNVDASEVTSKLLRNRSLKKDVLELKLNGYTLDLFDNTSRTSPLMTLFLRVSFTLE